MATKPEDMNDIDYLMSVDPLELSTKPGTLGCRKLDALIAHYRNQRALKESGARGARPKKDTGPKEAKLDLEALGLKKAGPKFVRRI